jgi:hypothetical protein
MPSGAIYEWVSWLCLYVQTSQRCGGAWGCMPEAGARCDAVRSRQSGPAVVAPCAARRGRGVLRHRT